MNNAKTLVADPGPEGTFAGLSADGRYLFYLSGGDLFRFDASSEETAQVTASGDATVVNVPAAGTSAYFASPSVLTEEANPLGEQAEEGEENLYFWDGAVTRFIATLTATDLAGEKLANGIQHDGLGFWVPSLSWGSSAATPPRAPLAGKLCCSSRAPRSATTNPPARLRSPLPGSGRDAPVSLLRSDPGACGRQHDAHGYGWR